MKFSSPGSTHEVLHRTLLKLCCPDMTQEKMDQSATEAQRAIMEHFMEPATRKKFRKNLQIERVNVGSTEAIDLNSLMIRIKDLEMDEKDRPMGDLSLTEDTVRIMRAGGDPWTGVNEGEDSDDWGEVNAGFVFNGCFRCGKTGHRAFQCPTYKDLVRTKCSKCMEKNISLCHRPEECKGHKSDDIDEDATRRRERRTGGYKSAKNVKEA